MTLSHSDSFTEKIDLGGDLHQLGSYDAFKEQIIGSIPKFNQVYRLNIFENWRPLEKIILFLNKLFI